MCINIWYLLFFFWFTLFCIVGYRFIHLIRTDSSAFLFKAEKYSIVYIYIYHSLVMHSSVKGHLVCFYVLAFVNSAAMNIGVHVFSSIMVFSGNMPTSRTVGSFGHFIPRILKESSYCPPILWPLDIKSWLTGKDSDAGKDWRQEEKRMTEDEMVGWHHWLNWYEFEQTLGDSEGQESLACCDLWFCKESDTI